ncbi:LIC11270 family surface protein [Leptospira sp. 'Mane']|uniref:LIC11270 family surface protein n=1 Tax=Leptospira sp. 'Mane' TaxID=3387407 RepID=UPI00398B59A8
MKPNLSSTIYRILFCLLFVFSVNCKTKIDLGKETTLPVLSSLFNNRMLLLLKGTYATDSPLDWSELNGGTGVIYKDHEDNGDGNGGDPAFSVGDLPLAGNLPIFIDIGEVRISSKYTKGLNDLTQIKDALDSRKFWNFIAPNRQVFCTVPYSFDDDTCKQNNGVQRAIEFFNGTGAQYPSNDPSSETWEKEDNPTETAATLNSIGKSFVGRQYYYSGIYFRSLVTGYAKDAGIPITTTTRFDNRLVYGLNIVPRNNYTPGTSAVAKTQIVPKMFPVLYSQKPTQADMEVRDGFDPFILEVRANMKENLMVHSYTTSRNTVVTYVGFSDVFNDHKGEGDTGGNILTRARIIYPETASSLVITGGGGSLRHTFGVFRYAEGDYTTTLPLAATPSKSTAKIKYLNPGSYKLVCLGDVSNIDGFPDTIVAETQFSIPEYPFRATYTVDLPCP